MKAPQRVLNVAALLWVTACSNSSFHDIATPAPTSDRSSAGSGDAQQGSSKATTEDASGNSHSSGAPEAVTSANSNASSSVTAATPASLLPSGPTSPLPPPPPPPNIAFGLLVNDLNCTMCHIEVHGTVVSVADADPLRSDSNGKVFGKWLVAGTYKAADDLTTPPRNGGIVVSDGIEQNYDNSGKEMPTSPATGKASFPLLDFSTLAAKMQGTVSASATPSSVASITKSHSGNVVLVGTAAAPITINRDIFIDGDLIIKGVYTGVGTIYVTGNIYIPANLKASKLASLPYSDDPAAATLQAKADLAAASADALGLATAKSIFVGDLEDYMDSTNGVSNRPTSSEGVRYNSIYTITPGTPFDGTVNGIWQVYNWFPEADFEKLYENLTPCWTSSQRTLAAGHHWGERTFDQIDAYLYAVDIIAGINRASSWTLNGGMIAQSMHIVSGADSSLVNANGVCAPARINFDYRLQNGVQLLEQLGTLFPQKLN